MNNIRPISLAAHDDADGFWQAAMALDREEVDPCDVVFSVAGEKTDLFGTTVTAAPLEREERIAVPTVVQEQLDKLVLHSSPERFALAYRLLRRWRAEPHLFSISSDKDVSRAADMVKSVRRDMHKMTAFVRFREVAGDGCVPAFVSWFEPEHYIVSATAPFFVKRFASMRWSILTPRRSAHWDGEELRLGDGCKRSDAVDGDPLEEVWRTYYANIFNPARLKVDAMRAQMPKKYWKNLPEAQMIAPLIQGARARTEAMIALGPTPQRRRLTRAPSIVVGDCASGSQGTGNPEEAAPGSLSDVASCLSGCQRCPLHAKATQAVPGEGPSTARLMIVGEQPGDQEDIAGRPFVGPAGKVLDAALQRVGIDRSATYLTNAVKHFKYEARGKVRLHKSPDASEIDHCRWWLDKEIEFVKPALIVGLGASAARSLLRRTVALKDVRARVLPLEQGRHALVTTHPSYLLRLQDEEQKRVAWRAFLDDLARAKDWLDARAAA